MQELRLWYNNHRKKIWITVGIVVALIVIIQFFNFLGKRNNSNNKLIDANAISEGNTIKEIRQETNVDFESMYSAVTGNRNSYEKLKTAAEVIGDFMDFCNEGKTSEAYNLLTDNCKEQLYNSLESFEQAYYQNVFGGERKTYSVENWVGDIYRVDITEDLLASGKSNNGYSKQDYIKVEKVNGEYKLNINNYIKYKEINKITEKENIKVEVLNSNIYMDREEYDIKITNNTENKITLDGKSYTDSLYLEDTKGAKYPAYTHELTNPMLNIESGQTKELTIKFYSRYVSNKIIDKMIFSNLIIYKGQGSEAIKIEVNV